MDRPLRFLPIATMIIGCALIEALTIYVLVIAFVLQGKIGAA